MIIYPAIDLRQGRCVRLRQGDPEAETVYGDDPAQMARHWVSQGAEWLHVVNLDGAFRHTTELQPGVRRLRSPDEALPVDMPINLRCLRAIRGAVDVPIQFGGGLRSLDDIELALSLGADRVVLGTVAVQNPELVRAALERYGADRIIVGLDARNGKVATHGWQNVSQLEAVELGHQMAALGVQRVLYTDISRDGMLSGVNVQATAHLGDTTGLLVIASGGVAGVDDIEALKRRESYNIDGVVVGQALYTGALDLARAITIGHAPLTRRSAGFVPFRRRDDGVQLLLLYNLFFEQWQFPRGGVEPGEDDLQCARREFAEETGLSVVRVYERCKTILEYMVRIRNYDIHRTVVYYLVEVGPGGVVLGHDNHSECRWCSLEEAKELLMETSPEQLPAWEAAAQFFNDQL